MRVLVIGGTGFIGRHTVGRLADEDYEVAVFSRDVTEGYVPEGTRLLRGDRRRFDASADELRRFLPEVVLDVTTMNEGDALGVMETFRGVAGRVVALSSQDVYRAYDVVRGLASGPPDPIPLNEDAPLRELSTPTERWRKTGRTDVSTTRRYSSSASSCPTLICPVPSFGSPPFMAPATASHRIFPYLKRMVDGRPAIPLEEGIAAWRWTHGYVEDVAAAIVLAVLNDRAAGRTYNVGEAAPPSWEGWVRAIGRAVGWDGEVLEVPRCSLPNEPMAGLNADQRWVVDTSRIRRELGYVETVSREEALRRTVSWEREHPPAETDLAPFDYDAEDAALARKR